MVGASAGDNYTEGSDDESWQVFHLPLPFCSLESFNESATFFNSSLSASSEVAALPVARKCLICTGSPNPTLALNTVYKLISSLGSFVTMTTLSPAALVVVVTDKGGDVFDPF